MHPPPGSLYDPETGDPMDLYAHPPPYGAIPPYGPPAHGMLSYPPYDPYAPDPYYGYELPYGYAPEDEEEEMAAAAAAAAGHPYPPPYGVSPYGYGPPPPHLYGRGGPYSRSGGGASSGGGAAHGGRHPHAPPADDGAEGHGGAADLRGMGRAVAGGRDVSGGSADLHGGHLPPPALGGLHAAGYSHPLAPGAGAGYGARRAGANGGGAAPSPYGVGSGGSDQHSPGQGAHQLPPPYHHPHAVPGAGRQAAHQGQPHQASPYGAAGAPGGGAGGDGEGSTDLYLQKFAELTQVSWSYDVYRVSSLVVVVALDEVLTDASARARAYGMQALKKVTGDGSSGGAAGNTGGGGAGPAAGGPGGGGIEDVIRSLSYFTGQVRRAWPSGSYDCGWMVVMDSRSLKYGMPCHVSFFMTTLSLLFLQMESGAGAVQHAPGQGAGGAVGAHHHHHHHQHHHGRHTHHVAAEHQRGGVGGAGAEGSAHGRGVAGDGGGR